MQMTWTLPSGEAEELVMQGSMIIVSIIRRWRTCRNGQILRDVSEKTDINNICSVGNKFLYAR